MSSFRKEAMRARGGKRMLVAGGQTCCSYFRDGLGVGNDFLQERANQHQSERNSAPMAPRAALGPGAPRLALAVAVGLTRLSPSGLRWRQGDVPGLGDTGMTLDEYNTRVKDIFAEQQSIAQETGKLALSGQANPTNPQFAQLMTKQWALVQDMARLNTELMMGVLTPK
jgi:hypothetical protein